MVGGVVQFQTGNIVQKTSFVSRPGRLLRNDSVLGIAKLPTEPRPLREPCRKQNHLREFSNSGLARELVMHKPDSQFMKHPLEKMLEFQDRSELKQDVLMVWAKENAHSARTKFKRFTRKNEGSHFNPLRFIQVYKEIFHRPLINPLFFSRLHPLPFRFLSAYHSWPLTWSQGWSAQRFDFFVNKVHLCQRQTVS